MQRVTNPKTPAGDRIKWSRIDVTSYDNVLQAIDDGRLDRIIEEHRRYMKANDCEIWAL